MVEGKLARENLDVLSNRLSQCAVISHKLHNSILASPCLAVRPSLGTHTMGSYWADFGEI
jgi:hypothetical protein